MKRHGMLEREVCLTSCLTFKHKGKKYLVTPEGPLVGSAKDQKLNIEMVDAAAEVENVATPNPKKDISSKQNKEKVAVEVKKEEVEKKEAKVEKEEEEKIVKPKPKPIDTKEKSGKTWREEMAEKYKKKK